MAIPVYYLVMVWGKPDMYFTLSSKILCIPRPVVSLISWW